MIKSKPPTRKHAVPASAIVIVLGFYLVITSTFYPPGSLSLYDAKRIIQLFLIAGCMLFALSWAPLRLQTVAQLNRIPPVSRVLLVLFFTLGIISSLRLTHPAYALTDVAMLFLLASMIAVTAASRDLAPEAFDKWAIALLSVLGFAVFIQEFMGFIVGWMLGKEFSYTRALMHFAHPRFFNQLQTWSIPIIAVLPLIFPKKAWLKPACIILLGLQWFLIIALAARGTLVSLVIAAIFIAMWLPGARQYWLKAHILGVLAGLAIYLSFLFLNSIFIPQSESGAFYANSAGRSMMHTSGRTVFWKHSINDALNNPWLGSGPSDYACDSETWLPAHPHSFPLQILGEWGIPATIILLILGLMIGFRFLSALKSPADGPPKEPALKAVLAISLLAGLIHSCLSGLLIMPASQTALILICGWNLSLSAVTTAKRHRFAFTFGAILVPTLIVLFVVSFSVHEQKHLPTRTSNLKMYGPMTPRFWQDGRVCEYTYDAIARLE